MRRHGQRGVALLVALLVVALAAMLIAGLLARGELAFARTRNALRAAQAEAYAQGLEHYAGQVLLETWQQGPDTRASAWAMPLPPQTVPGGMISASMRDLGGCFNLNNLGPDVPRRADWRRTFEALLGQLGLDPRIAIAVAAWQDPAASGEDGRYMAATPPHRAHQGPFTHVSELRLVAGVDGAAYARLLPHVCALSPDTRLNVNTAGVPLLQALGLGRADAERVWQQGQAQFNDVRSFIGEARTPELTAMQDLLDTRSEWFLARGEVVLDDIPFTFFSVIQRAEGSGIQVVARSLGSDGAWSGTGGDAAATLH
ncbi:MAG: type II secretion system minor pseudopilin GspK [Xanthomonadales bacterium]|nr:type II secretion system minor pseudopilin GspK [Xanthomonadales bacterium]